MNSPSATSLAARAQACLDVGDLPQAIKLYDELNITEPDNAEGWLMSGALVGERGSPKEAVVLLQKAISINPNYPEAYLTLAHLHKASDALTDSYDAVKSALDIDASYDEAWVFLGSLSCELNRFEEAENASREAIRRWPENAQAHISLATALCYLGREIEAEPVVRQAMTLEGGNASTVKSLLGRILLGKCEYADAEPLIKSSLEEAPNDVTLLINLANIKTGLQQFDEAEAVFLNIIELSPQMTDAWTGLGVVYQNKFQLTEAERCYRKANELDPTSLSPAYNLSLLLEINGDLAGAESFLRDIIAQYPGQLDSIGALAGVLEKSGNIDHAIETIEPVMAIPEKNVRVAQSFQRLCDKTGLCDEAEQYLKDVIEGQLLSSENNALMQYALGNLYDKSSKFDNAFKHYELANENMAKPYNTSTYTQLIDEMLSTFSSDVIAAIPAADNNSEQPIFIVGMPRSGTSLVEQILSSHSMIYGAGELNNIRELTEKIPESVNNQQSYPAAINSLTQDTVNTLANEYLGMIDGLSDGAKRVTDKMPHNFEHLGLIHALFPKAKIIHCVRDARDTCLSCYFQNFFGHHPYTANLEYLGQHHNDYTRLMSHWKKLGIPMLEVSYEDLVQDVEKLSKQLVEYCDLDWEDECLRFYDNTRYTRTASYDQVRQPVYKGSVERWKNYEAHLSPLIKVLAN